MASLKPNADPVDPSEYRPPSNFVDLLISDQIPNVRGTGTPRQPHPGFNTLNIPSSDPVSTLPAGGAVPPALPLDFDFGVTLDPPMDQWYPDLHFSTTGHAVDTLGNPRLFDPMECSNSMGPVNQQQIPNVINIQRGAFPQTGTQVAHGG